MYCIEFIKEVVKNSTRVRKQTLSDICFINCLSWYLTSLVHIVLSALYTVSHKKPASLFFTNTNITNTHKTISMFKACGES